MNKMKEGGEWDENTNTLRIPHPSLVGNPAALLSDLPDRERKEDTGCTL